MISAREIRLLVVLVAACVVSAIHAQQSEEAKRQLKFEVSTIPVELPYYFPEVEYVGDFHVTEDRSLEPWFYSIRATSQWKEMSEEQRQFINKLHNDYQYKKVVRSQRIGSPVSIKSEIVRTPKGTRTYRVLGVSEDDVRKMARGVIDLLNNEAREALHSQKKRLEAKREVIAEAEKILPELQTQCRQLEVQADGKIVEYIEANYGIDSKETIPEHARKSMEDLARHMRLVDFELLGLQAKIDSISRFKADGRITNQDTLAKLDQMLITNEVERAGMLARRNAYITAFKQAKELCAIIKIRDEVAAKKLIWQEKLSGAEALVPDIVTWLANPPSFTRPVEVYENKVTIHPVRTN
jgi:hypothetical protein